VILLDSSALIEFYRPEGDAEVRARVAEVIAADRAATNGVVQVEVISFARGPRVVRTLEADFRAFHWLELTRAVFDRACSCGSELRAGGVTVPATDLIIAASAIENGATLYHLDRHFDAITELGALRGVNLSR
jgi:predicted nucleic acid-binding protein